MVGKGTVLIVEEGTIPLITIGMAQALEALGFTVICAYDHTTVYRAIINHEPAVVLANPLMSGVAFQHVLDMIRSVFYSPALVILTSRILEPLEQEFERFTPAILQFMPYQPEELAAKIAQLVTST